VFWQQLGFSFWLIFITGVNTLDVAIYWFKAKHSQDFLWALIGRGIFLTVAIFFILSKSSADYFNPKVRRTLRNAILLSFCIWSLEAVLKQAVAFNFRHWEGAYSFFILFYFVLCALLPVQMKILQNE